SGSYILADCCAQIALGRSKLTLTILRLRDLPACMLPEKKRNRESESGRESCRWSPRVDVATHTKREIRKPEFFCKCGGGSSARSLCSDARDLGAGRKAEKLVVVYIRQIGVDTTGV